MFQSRPVRRQGTAPGSLEPWGFLAMARSHFLVPLGVAAASLSALALLAWMGPGFVPSWLPPATFLVVVAAAFWGWVLSLRRLRALEDVPLSRIASTAQGYARLEGRAAAFPERPLRSPFSGQPCCWYSYKMLTFTEGGKVESTESETTDWSFLMIDGSGECVVDPAGANVVSVRVNRYRDQHQQWWEKVILPRDPLCVVGQFSTAAGGEASETEIDSRAGARIAEWKKDMAGLRKRFDLDGDGEFTAQEWELLRRQARRELKAELAATRHEHQNLISKPTDDRPFLISVQSSERLARDLKIWAWLHLALFALAVAALAAWLL